MAKVNLIMNNAALSFSGSKSKAKSSSDGGSGKSLLYPTIAQVKGYQFKV